MEINASYRTFKVGKNTIQTLEQAFGRVEMLYALCQHFVQRKIEGDELYTNVSENKLAHLLRLDDSADRSDRPFHLQITVWSARQRLIQTSDSHSGSGH